MADRFVFCNAVVEILVEGRLTADEYAVLRLSVPPGAPTFAERHEDATRVLFPLEGAFEIGGGDAPRTLQAPDCAVLRAGERRFVTNVSATTARYLLLCLPSRYERLVREWGRPWTPTDDVLPRDDDGPLFARAAMLMGVHLDDPARSSPAAPARQPEARMTYDMMGASFEEVVSSRDGRMVVATVETAPGHRTPLHTHEDPICFCALEGGIDVYSAAAGGWNRLAPGQALLVPARVHHGTSNDGAMPARFAVVSTEKTREFYHHFAMRNRAGQRRR